MAVKFIRKGGRIIPIQVKNEAQAGHNIVKTGQNRLSLLKVASASALGLGAAYGAGRLARHSDSLLKLGQFGKSNLFNRAAKIAKFGGASGVGIYAGHEMAALDKRTNDEKGKLLNIGAAGKSPLMIGAGVLVAYGGYRVAKRFEVAGKMGLNLLKKANWSKIRHLRDI